ncbi:MAG: hypothetical protein LBG09_00110 [Puniceicoccales bacterium]|nr:hypothetical protein [Puniceicoccales bacterium]
MGDIIKTSMKNVKQNASASFIVGALLLLPYGSVLADESGASWWFPSFLRNFFKRDVGEEPQKLVDEAEAEVPAERKEYEISNPNFTETAAENPANETKTSNAKLIDGFETEVPAKREKRVTFAPDCLQSPPKPKKLTRIPKENMSESMQQLRSERVANMKMSDIRKGYAPALLLQKAMGILIPGDPWNFSRRPSLETLLSTEEIQKRSVEIWKNYTLDECIEQLQDAETAFKFFYTDKQLSKDSRRSYGVLAAIVGIYRWGFEALRDGYDPIAVRAGVEDWLQKNGYEQRNGGNFFAVDTAFQAAVERAVEESAIGLDADELRIV